MKVVIIDDSAKARSLLRLMLKEYAPNVQPIGEAANAEDGLNMIFTLQPDAVFLDIEMPGKSGLDVAEILLEKDLSIPIVFTTAYNEYAINAFRLSAIDYLLKPIQENELIEAVEKLSDYKKNKDLKRKLQTLSNNLKNSHNQVLCVPIQGGNEYLDLDDILYLEADGSYVKIVVVEGKDRVVAKNLKYFETALGNVKHFLRSHRSFLVNMHHLAFHSKQDGGCLQLKNGSQIPISRERKPDVVHFLKNITTE